jgi:carbon monoxide dehydrogenase subunit G
MAIALKESFEVAAALEDVWRFMLDPRSVAACLPGATMDEAVDDRTFRGSVKLRVGAITASYRGQVRLTRVDETAREVEMLAEGREPGGGSALGTVSSRLRARPGGGTEVQTEASIDLSGRIVQLGRGMIEGVARQLFAEFAARVRERLESAAPSGVGAAAAPPRDATLRIVPLLLRAAWQRIAALFRALLGRPGA